MEDLNEEKLKWEQQKAKVDFMYVPETNILDLDIGGTHKITTTR